MYVIDNLVVCVPRNSVHASAIASIHHIGIEFSYLCFKL